MSQRPESTSPTQRERSSDAPTMQSSSGDADRAGAADRLTDVARDTATQAKRKAGDLYRETSNAAADASDAIDATADALADSGHETLSQVAASISDKVRTFSSYLENRPLEDLIGDARALARRNPALFMAGGVALGFTLSRFLKASGSGNRRMVS